MANETNNGLITLFLSFWWMWIFLIVIAIIKIKLPYLKGLIGEKFVSRKLFKLDPAHYKIMDDLLLPSNGNLNMTQLDHVVISNYGIFCIETKSYKGWIFGNANDKYWTQVIYKHKERFYNPLRQNYAHTKAVEELIKSKYPKAQILSFVAFPIAGKLKISGTDSVGYARDIVRKIENYKTQTFTDVERDEIFNILANANIQDKK
ncbi:MAG: nuclease-related domain-containing protein, partial [Patescibacteria group bacterium]|nr:nuclease-related domain-containing protein [Patescibacteria group bacterium]